MVYLFDYFAHRRDCKRKQDERVAKIASLPSTYLGPFTEVEKKIQTTSIDKLVDGVHNGSIQPIDILRNYGKATIRAHDKTNCATEILFPEAEKWLQDGTINLKGPLAGIPISLKDSIVVGGWDTTVGYSKYVGQPAKEDGILVKLLKEAGAVPFVKTALPITLLSFESTNDVWGQAKNPHNPKYSPGGSTGGEGALLASGASIIGIGSDVAGSVRIPAHFSGCYSLRCSTGRWPKMGFNTSMPGQEGIPSVFSPMAWTLDALTYFTRSFIKIKPWRLDYSVHPLEWRDNVETEYQEKKTLKVGVLRDDGVVTPSPACARALDMVAETLRSHGHTVIDVSPPSPYEALVLASQLLNADGCTTFKSFFRTGETDDPGAAQMGLYMRLPRFIKRLHYWWIKYVKRDDIWAGLLENWHPKTAAENWKLVSKREAFKARWHEWWNQQGLDIMITVPNATPAVPHGGMHDAVSSCNYTFLFNLLDYTAGIMPVTKVDPVTDILPADFKLSKLNGVARGAYIHYDAVKMAGLPVGVQVVGRRLEEEKVLSVMSRILSLLEEDNKSYELIYPYMEDEKKMSVR